MSIFNKTFVKFAVGFGGIVVLVIMPSIFWADIKDSWSQRAENKDQEDFYTAMEKEQDRLLEAYKNDTYGGATPEETWGMFIAALEKGDTDLAAKYFIVEKQEEMKKELDQIVQSDPNIDSWLNALKVAISSGAMTNRAELIYTSIVTTPIKVEGTELFIKPGEYESSATIILNEYTNKWKIESL